MAAAGSDALPPDYRLEDYRKSGLPMLPITHGAEFTRLQVLLYTLLLVAATLIPFVYGMSGSVYLLAALALGGVFLRLNAEINWHRLFHDLIADFENALRAV